jgi:sarcosine oxidase subunit beta
MKDIHFISLSQGWPFDSPTECPSSARCPRASGFFIAAGHEGDGIALSPITGVMTADLVESKKPEFAVDSFKTDRFSSR